MFLSRVYIAIGGYIWYTVRIARGRWRPPLVSQLKDNAFFAIGLYFCKILSFDLYGELNTLKYFKWNSQQGVPKTGAPL